LQQFFGVVTNQEAPGAGVENPLSTLLNLMKDNHCYEFIHVCEKYQYLRSDDEKGEKCYATRVFVESESSNQNKRVAINEENFGQYFDQWNNNIRSLKSLMQKRFEKFQDFSNLMARFRNRSFIAIRKGENDFDEMAIVTPKENIDWEVLGRGKLFYFAIMVDANLKEAYKKMRPFQDYEAQGDPVYKKVLDVYNEMRIGLKEAFCEQIRRELKEQSDTFNEEEEAEKIVNNMFPSVDAFKYAFSIFSSVNSSYHSRCVLTSLNLFLSLLLNNYGICKHLEAISTKKDENKLEYQESNRDKSLEFVRKIIQAFGAGINKLFLLVSDGRYFGLVKKHILKNENCFIEFFKPDKEGKVNTVNSVNEIVKHLKEKKMLVVIKHTDKNGRVKKEFALINKENFETILKERTFDGQFQEENKVNFNGETKAEEFRRRLKEQQRIEQNKNQFMWVNTTNFVHNLAKEKFKIECNEEQLKTTMVKYFDAFANLCEEIKQAYEKPEGEKEAALNDMEEKIHGKIGDIHKMEGVVAEEIFLKNFMKMLFFYKKKLIDAFLFSEMQDSLKENHKAQLSGYTEDEYNKYLTFFVVVATLRKGDGKNSENLLEEISKIIVDKFENLLREAGEIEYNKATEKSLTLAKLFECYMAGLFNIMIFHPSGSIVAKVIEKFREIFEKAGENAKGLGMYNKLKKFYTKHVENVLSHETEKQQFEGFLTEVSRYGVETNVANNTNNTNVANNTNNTNVANDNVRDTPRTAVYISDVIAKARTLYIKPKKTKRERRTQQKLHKKKKVVHHYDEFSEDEDQGKSNQEEE
jgi:hypothetical protein